MKESLKTAKYDFESLINEVREWNLFGCSYFTCKLVVGDSVLSLLCFVFRLLQTSAATVRLAHTSFLPFKIGRRQVEGERRPQGSDDGCLVPRCFRRPRQRQEDV
jgi:hypothetical protein